VATNLLLPLEQPQRYLSEEVDNDANNYTASSYAEETGTEYLQEIGHSRCIHDVVDTTISKPYPVQGSSSMTKLLKDFSSPLSYIPS
jgi:hypothetical protein